MANSGVIPMTDDVPDDRRTRSAPRWSRSATMEFPPELLSLVPPQTARACRACCRSSSTAHVLRVVGDQSARSARGRQPPLRHAEGRRHLRRPCRASSRRSSTVLRRRSLRHGATCWPSWPAMPRPRTSTGDAIDIEGASSAPIVKYVNTVLAQAIQARASDIHFEPFENEFKIRYRVDGALYEMAPPPALARRRRHLAHQGHVAT